MGLFSRKTVSAAPTAPTRKNQPKRNVFRSLFQAANSSRLEANLPTSPSSADDMVLKDWVKLVARSRHAAINNDHAAKFLQMVRDNVAGPNGFALHAHVSFPDGTPDDEASEAIENAYKIQSRRGNFDVTGQLSRADFERLWIQTIARDGEAIARIRTGKDAGTTGFSLEMVDCMALDVMMNSDDKKNGGFTRFGIEYNKFGRPVAYNFRVGNSLYGGYASSSKVERVPAELVIHDFEQVMVGQKRGLPWMKTALWRLSMLEGYENAAVTKARVGSSDMFFFEDEHGEPDPDEPVEEEWEAAPGTGRILPPGLKVRDWKPNYPAGEFGVFAKSILQSISSGLGVSYNNLASDLTSVNFSSIRQGALDEREMWKGKQAMMRENFCRRCFEAWLERAVLTGEIKTKGNPLKVERLDACKSVDFVGRSFDWIDPKSEIATIEKMLDLNLTTRTEIIRKQGKDAGEVWVELAKEKEQLNSLGLKSEVTPAGTNVVSSFQNKKSEEDE